MKKIKTILKKIFRIKKEKVLIPYIKGHYLDNKCALITGASSGIGYSMAEAFIRNGATVIITGRNKDNLDKAKNKLLSTCNCDESKIIIGELDISKVDFLEEKLLSIISKSNKKVDIFVNNAGVNGEAIFPETTEEEYDRILNTNLKGTYFLSQSIAKYMVKNEIEGNILNVTSSSALRPGISPYIVSKWGERSLTLGMAKKYLPYGSHLDLLQQL